MQNFIWLVYVENQIQNPQKLEIPYDCEFILIQFEKGARYKLTEIYTVKRKSFSLEFGAWDKGLHLKSSMHFYGRRLNFQKVELRVVCRKDGAVRFQIK